jgi:4-hydroxybenzoate polyprenyltransferase
VGYWSIDVSSRAVTLPAPPAGPAPRGLARAVRAARIVHPFPTLLNVAATAGLALVATGGDPPAGVLSRMLAVMLCAQASIGVTNDYFDRDLDAFTKPWKPVASHLVGPRPAQCLAGALAVAALALAATLGPRSSALAALGLACGLAYDVRLKRSAWSALPYMVALPVLPAWVWVTLGQWRPALWWMLPLGALVGLSLHLQNTLGDIDADAAHGVRGFAHRIGARGAMVLGWASFAAALALAFALAPALSYDVAVFAPAAAAGLVCLGLSIGVWSLRRDEMGGQVGFGLLGVGSAVLAVGWLAAVA